MNLREILDSLNLDKHPSGLGGCQNDTPFDSCEYDITIFDNTKQPDQIFQIDEKLFQIHHGSLDETRTSILIQYDKMQVINDESWELRMFLSKIKSKLANLYANHAKDCLIESTFCCSKAISGLKNNDVFAGCWQKCASFYLAEAISAINNVRPSPSHLLDNLRSFQKNTTNEKISLVNETIGIERATLTLLDRMCKSTIGFSDMAENNQNSKLIQPKYDYFIKNAMLANCYFYLGYLNKINFIKIKDSISRKPDLIHVLKVAFDLDDSSKIEKNSTSIQRAASEILATFSVA